MQLFKYFIILVFFSSNIVFSQDFGDKIESVLTNTNAEVRGKITEENGVFVLHYYDKYEKDSDANYLKKKGFQGGGASWLPMIYAAFNIYEDNMISKIKYVVEVSGVSFESPMKEDVLMISRVISLIKSDKTVMDSLIKEATTLDIMK